MADVEAAPQARGAQRRPLVRRVCESGRSSEERLRQRLLAGEAGSMEALLWQYAFGRPLTEATTNGHGDPSAMFEDVLMRLGQEQSTADPQVSRRTPGKLLGPRAASPDRP
jgi:hypothetical protein